MTLSNGCYAVIYPSRVLRGITTAHGTRERREVTTYKLPFSMVTDMMWDYFSQLDIVFGPRVGNG